MRINFVRIILCGLFCADYFVWINLCKLFCADKFVRIILCGLFSADYFLRIFSKKMKILRIIFKYIYITQKLIIKNKDSKIIKIRKVGAIRQGF